MKSFVIVVALCVFGVQTSSAQTAGNGLDSCLSMGLAFPISCQAEIGAAQSFFGIELSNLDSLQEVDVTTQQIAGNKVFIVVLDYLLFCRVRESVGGN